MKIAICEESVSDISAIEELIAQALVDAPYTNQHEQRIVQKLRAAGQLTLSLVAKEGGRVIGYVAVSPVTVAELDLNWYGLGPIAISPEVQGQGIGAQLMREALLKLRELGAAGCVVLGEPDYYKRFGFKAETGLSLAGVPSEYFLAIAFSGQIPRGEVNYRDAFKVTS